LSAVYFPGTDGESLVMAAATHELTDTFETEPRYERDAPEGSRSAVVWDAFDQDEPLVLEDSRVSEVLTEESPARSVIIYPLGEYGVLIASSPEPYAFDDTDEALVEILATSLRASLDRVERESRLREQNERLDEFASILSHDLRNPLNIAEGHLELAREADDPTPNHDAIGRSLDRIGTLVEDMLTLAREGKAGIETQHVNLAEFASSCWMGVKTGDAELRVELDGAVAIDESRLRQLFENLFRNAVEHAVPDDSTEWLQVTVGSLGEGDGFFVADNGVGIPESDRERVLSAGYSTGSGGTGLGLSIVSEVARAHGWSVSVTEGQDGGARFEFRGVVWA
jgi:signal transduction histidine kinase